MEISASVFLWASAPAPRAGEIQSGFPGAQSPRQVPTGARVPFPRHPRSLSAKGRLLRGPSGAADPELGACETDTKFLPHPQPLSTKRQVAGGSRREPRCDGGARGHGLRGPEHLCPHTGGRAGLSGCPGGQLKVCLCRGARLCVHVGVSACGSLCFLGHEHDSVTCMNALYLCVCFHHVWKAILFQLLIHQ